MAQWGETTEVALDAAEPGRGPEAELHDILCRRGVTPVFQPIVDLATGEIVGVEALARGPAGSALQTPDRLFAAARRAGRLAELDVLCRDRATEEVLRVGVAGPIGLFLNVEPEVAPDAGGGGPPSARALLDGGLDLVLELTERDLTADPAGLLAFAERARAAGFRIALDDVGAVPASLALMPFLRPEIVKLDLRLVQSRPGPAVAEIMSAVTAYAEQSGAVVLAEGIETVEHVGAARSLGATLGQGWFFGRPAPAGDLLPRLRPPARPLALRRTRPPLPVTSPFATVAAVRPAVCSTKPHLVAVSQLLERQAAAQGELAVVLAAYEEAANFTPGSRRRYAALARRAAFVVVLGAGLGGEEEPGVRGANLVDPDPVLGEWDVVVVGPHFAAALVARDLDPSDDPNREFAYVLTHDRPLVLEVARSLMARAVPSPVTPTQRITSPVGV